MEDHQKNQKKEIYKSASLSDFKALFPEGYVKREYQTETEDGYILKLFRIQRADSTQDSTFDQARQPILLQHGVHIDSVVCFLSNDPELALGLLLADNSFDVWLGNNRGCRFCREHSKLSSESSKFWNFSFDQLAEFDIPALLKKVSEETGGQKVPYFGVSQGCTQMLAALSIKENRERVIPYLHSVLGYAPAVYFNNPHSRGFVDIFKGFIVEGEKSGLNHTGLGSGRWIGNDPTLAKGYGVASFEELKNKIMTEAEIQKAYEGWSKLNLDIVH